MPPLLSKLILPVAFLEALDISGKPSAFIRMRMSPATGNLAVPLCTETAPGMSEPTALGNPVGIEHWGETEGLMAVARVATLGIPYCPVLIPPDVFQRSKPP